MENSDKFLTMISFARRSGKIVYGLDNLSSSRKKLFVLAVSDTASDNLMRNMALLSEKSNVPLVVAPALENSVGNNVKALGLIDRNMAQAVIEYVQGGETKYTIRYGNGGNAYGQCHQ